MKGKELVKLLQKKGWECSMQSKKEPDCKVLFF